MAFVESPISKFSRRGMPPDPPEVPGLRPRRSCLLVLPMNQILLNVTENPVYR